MTMITMKCIATRTHIIENRWLASIPGCDVRSEGWDAEDAVRNAISALRELFLDYAPSHKDTLSCVFEVQEGGYYNLNFYLVGYASLRDFFKFTIKRNEERIEK